MTADELRAVFGAMTARPWQDDDGRCLTSRAQDDEEDHERMSVVLLGANDDANQAGLLALANHADAFLELVDEVERYIVHPTGFHYDVMRDALRKVHAVGKEGT